MSFEDISVLKAFVKAQAQHPMARKTINEQTIYQCHNDFGDLNEFKNIRYMVPIITDFGAAQRGDRPGPLLHPIQPDNCQAPEVILGAGWTYSADIWNFGILVSMIPLNLSSVGVLTVVGMEPPQWPRSILPGQAAPILCSTTLSGNDCCAWPSEPSSDPAREKDAALEMET